MDPYYLDFSDAAPSNYAAEAAILGSILVDNARLAEVRKVLQPDDFALASHRVIYARMLAMSGPIDDLTLTEAIWANKDDIGATPAVTIAGLTEGIYRRMNLAEYLAIVKEKSYLRQVMTVCEKAYKLAATQGVDAKEIGREVVRELKKVFGGKA